MAIKRIDNYTKAEKVNPYIEDLKGLSIGDAFEVEVQTRVSENTGKTLGLTGEKGLVQAGARANGFTARVQEQRNGEDGKVTFVFQLFALQESGPRERKGKGEKATAKA